MRIILWGLVLAATVDASVIEGLDLPEQCRRAEWIVRGQVTAQKSEWAEGQIVTVTRLRVSEVLKGRDVPRWLAVRQLGGTVGDKTMTVPGNARLAANEEVVLFLSHDESYAYILGLAHGKFHVRGRWLERDLDGLLVVGRKEPEMPIRIEHLRRLVKP